MDERMIEQVLINLVKNALEALKGSSNPVLTLSVEEHGNETILAVTDNGQGIPEDQLDHIFIPFYSTRETGSGVGLSFSQHIMRMHNGRIHVQSREGEGTEIQLIFTL
jgi:signal transduction histidine kinase